jgi:hypothetical protein
MRICQILYEGGYITYMRTDSKVYSDEFINSAFEYITKTYTTEYINKFQRELILGKRIKASDVTNLLDRHSWQSGTVYTQYDDTDQYMYDKEFYVIKV